MHFIVIFTFNLYNNVLVSAYIRTTSRYASQLIIEKEKEKNLIDLGLEPESKTKTDQICWVVFFFVFFLIEF